MKVKMLCGIASDNWSAAPGEAIDVSDDDARRLIQGGYAEPFREQVRTATAEKRETATKRKGKEKE